MFYFFRRDYPWQAPPGQMSSLWMLWAVQDELLVKMMKDTNTVYVANITHLTFYLATQIA